MDFVTILFRGSHLYEFLESKNPIRQADLDQSLSGKNLIFTMICFATWFSASSISST